MQINVCNTIQYDTIQKTISYPIILLYCYQFYQYIFTILVINKYLKRKFKLKIDTYKGIIIGNSIIRNNIK